MTPPASSLRVLLVEPWFGGSHRAWAEGYARASRHRVELVTHAGWSWRWRLEGGALTLAREAADRVAASGPPDVVLVSGMINLPAFLGFARRSLGGVPVALYMHENQLTYPPGATPAAATYAIINWLSVAAADRVFFNSEFHRREFFASVPGAVFARAGDHRHDHELEAAVARSEVLAVGIDLRRLDGLRRPDGGPPVVLWNHRWEHDKDPDTLAATLLRLAAEGIGFRLILAGERVGEPPAARLLEDRLGGRIVHSGYASPGDYPGLLRRADVAVSTARQEFFGVAMVEASYAGALPVVPDRLVYPELLPSAVHGPCLYRDEEELADRLRWALTRPDDARRTAATLREPMRKYDWDSMAPRYDEALARVAG